MKPEVQNQGVSWIEFFLLENSWWSYLIFPFPLGCTELVMFNRYKINQNLFLLYKILTYKIYKILIYKIYKILVIYGNLVNLGICLFKLNIQVYIYQCHHIILLPNFNLMCMGSEQCPVFLSSESTSLGFVEALCVTFIFYFIVLSYIFTLPSFKIL